MAGNGNGGGGQRHEPMSDNQVTMVRGKIGDALRAIEARKAEIVAVLPPDITYERFFGNIRQLFFSKPDIFSCTPASILRSCIQSAYDGLRLDGVEATLVAHNVKIRGGRGVADRWEEQAQYFPMVRGIIKQILTSDAISSIRVEPIYEKDDYRIDLSKNNPLEWHRPCVVGDRGNTVLFYSLAFLTDGSVSFEYMTMADVTKVKAEAKTQAIWGKWDVEMGRKSVARRHRKRLPLGRAFIDVEAQQLFPQFDRTQPHPALADDARAARGRPTRESLEHQQSDGVPLDIRDDEVAVTIDHGAPAEEKGRTSHQDRQQGVDDSTETSEPANDLPETDEAWAQWAEGIETVIGMLTDVDAVNEVWARSRPALEKAPSVIADGVTESLRDRIADLAAGGTDGAGPSAAD